MWPTRLLDRLAGLARAALDADNTVALGMVLGAIVVVAAMALAALA